MSAHLVLGLMAFACLVAALGCMVAWSFAMLIDGNRVKHHLVRAGGFVAAAVAAGVTASYV